MACGTTCLSTMSASSTSTAHPDPDHPHQSDAAGAFCVPTPRRSPRAVARRRRARGARHRDEELGIIPLARTLNRDAEFELTTVDSAQRSGMLDAASRFWSERMPLPSEAAAQTSTQLAGSAAVLVGAPALSSSCVAGARARGARQVDARARCGCRHGQQARRRLSGRCG